MKDGVNIQYGDGFGFDGNFMNENHFMILAKVANFVTRHISMDVTLMELLKGLSFEKLAKAGVIDRDELQRFYESPEKLLYTLFDIVLEHLDYRIGRLLVDDPDCTGRFDLAYRSVISDRVDMGAVIISGLNGAVVNRLFFLFMSVMDNENRNETSFVLQNHWGAWYKKLFRKYNGVDPGRMLCSPFSVNGIGQVR